MSKKDTLQPNQELSPKALLKKARDVVAEHEGSSVVDRLWAQTNSLDSKNTLVDMNRGLEYTSLTAAVVAAIGTVFSPIEMELSGIDLSSSDMGCIVFAIIFMLLSTYTHSNAQKISVERVDIMEKIITEMASVESRPKLSNGTDSNLS